MKRNIQLLIAYDGTDFHGWQSQPDLRTVQSEIETVLQHVVRHPVGVIASGRTDAGVHAAGQVANFITDCDLVPGKLRHAVACRLPNDLTVMRMREVPLGFHATQCAKSKLYRYRIYNAERKPVQHRQQRYVYHYYHPLDISRMRQAAGHFVGTHDFKALAAVQASEKPSYLRTVLCCEVYRVYEEIRVDVQGTGFLYHQVRNMVGTLIEVGRGHWEPGRVRDIIKSRDRSRAGPTARAQGLCLQWVEYPPDRDISSRLDPELVSARSKKLETLKQQCEEVFHKTRDTDT